MPLVGGFIALCVDRRGPVAVEAPKTKIYGNFFKVKVTPNCDTIKGKLVINFNAYRICHGGIKVCLQGHLELTGRPSGCQPIDICEHYPTETILSCDDLLRGQKRLNFFLTIPPGRQYPAPFMTSNGSLVYRIVALIRRDDSWEIFAKKLISFKGYYNLANVELSPFVERKMITTNTGKVTSTFTVPNTVTVMGQNESLEGILELNGLLGHRVNATLIFLRNINYGRSVQTEIIFSQNRQSEVHQNNVSFKWAVGIPMMTRISYSSEVMPMYSVRYYLKYKVVLEKLDDKEQHVAMANGIVEVKVGTLRGENTNVSKNESRETDRRMSVMSLASTQSLPPAYSQLQSRSASMLSMETLPPRYHEIKE